MTKATENRREIERKFLVAQSSWRSAISDQRTFRQGYLNLDPDRTVRIRLDDQGARLTVKGRAVGMVRPEYEYEIPRRDAEAMLATLCEGEPITKTRFIVPHGQHRWEIDVFQGANEGLVIAEVELEHPNESIEHPPWLGVEVTDDTRYFNSQLAQRPYQTWD